VRTNGTIRRILVAIKNPFARPSTVLTKAAQIAQACGAEMDLFHDLSTPLIVGAVDMQKAVRTLLKDGRRAALAGLERLALELRTHGLVVHTSAEWDYPPHEAIIRRAQRSGADLIITHCRARHRFPALLGYTDWSLLRDSPVPVLLIKSRRAYRRARILAAIDPLHRFSKPSGLDSRILREAQMLGRALQTLPHVVHAYLPQPLGPSDDKAPASLARRIEAGARSDARIAFNQALRAFPAASFRHHLIEAHPVAAITTTARNIKAGIVVLGAISRRGLKRLFIGNTAEQVLDELRCDLLVVKSGAFVTPIPRGRRGAYFISASVAT
jgi:universal stress protein E